MDSVVPRERGALTAVPSFRYKMVRFMSGVAAFFSVPMLAVTVGSLWTGGVQPFVNGDGGIVGAVSVVVELLLAIPVYRAIKQRRRAGLLALLFAQAGVIMQKGYQALTTGSWAGVLFSLVWLGILFSIKDELDQ